MGSRDFPALDLVQALVRALDPAKFTIVSGGAKGVDRTAEIEAIARDIPVISIPADWGRLGRSAGAIRNGAIVEASDAVIAFWDGKSPGTKSTLVAARRREKPVTVYFPGTTLPDVLQDAKDMNEGAWP